MIFAGPLDDVEIERLGFLASTFLFSPFSLARENARTAIYRRYSGDVVRCFVRGEKIYVATARPNLFGGEDICVCDVPKNYRRFSSQTLPAQIDIWSAN